MAQVGDRVELWRIFTAENGQSRMEQLVDLPGMPAVSGASAPEPFTAKQVTFTRLAKDMAPRWHCAPRRQMMATLVGEGELETGDGQVLVVRPGVVTLLEDLEGQGHLTRPRGDVDRLAMVIPLAT